MSLNLFRVRNLSSSADRCSLQHFFKEYFEYTFLISLNSRVCLSGIHITHFEFSQKSRWMF